jgi:hypothetical protein
MLMSACADQPREAPPRAAPSGKEPTDDLLGQALAEALGLRELAREPGEVADKQGCQTAASETPEGGLYCLDGAIDPSSPDRDLEIWILGRRLSGHSVVQADIEAATELLDAGST